MPARASLTFEGDGGMLFEGSLSDKASGSGGGGVGAPDFSVREVPTEGEAAQAITGVTDTDGPDGRVLEFAIQNIPPVVIDDTATPNGTGTMSVISDVTSDGHTVFLQRTNFTLTAGEGTEIPAIQIAAPEPVDPAPTAGYTITALTGLNTGGAGAIDSHTIIPEVTTFTIPEPPAIPEITLTHNLESENAAGVISKSTGPDGVQVYKFTVVEAVVLNEDDPNSHTVIVNSTPVMIPAPPASVVVNVYYDADNFKLWQVKSDASLDEEGDPIPEEIVDFVPVGG